MTHVTVLSGPERRRRWSDADKLRIVEAAFAPGACVSDVARRFDVSTGLIYTWRRRAQRGVSVPLSPKVAVGNTGRISNLAEGAESCFADFQRLSG